MKRICAIGLALALFAGLVPPAFAEEKTIRFDPLWDPALLVAGFAGAAASRLALEGSARALPDPAGLSGLDAALRFDYSEGLSTLSSGATGLAMLWPALFAFTGEKEELFPAAVACAEALALTYAAKNAMKALFPKARPYAYGEGELSAELREEAWESFPSGHAALAFCAATSFAVLSLELAPESPATPWLVAGGYGLAAGASALRVFAGEHFAGDVLAGTALGSGIGWLATRLHISKEGAEGGSAELKAALRETGPAIVLRLGL